MAEAAPWCLVLLKGQSPAAPCRTTLHRGLPLTVKIPGQGHMASLGLTFSSQFSANPVQPVPGRCPSPWPALQAHVETLSPHPAQTRFLTLPGLCLYPCTSGPCSLPGIDIWWPGPDPSASWGRSTCCPPRTAPEPRGLVMATLGPRAAPLPSAPTPKPLLALTGGKWKDGEGW